MSPARGLLLKDEGSSHLMIRMGPPRIELGAIPFQPSLVGLSSRRPFSVFPTVTSLHLNNLITVPQERHCLLLAGSCHFAFTSCVRISSATIVRAVSMNIFQQFFRTVQSVSRYLENFVIYVKFEMWCIIYAEPVGRDDKTVVRNRIQYWTKLAIIKLIGFNAMAKGTQKDLLNCELPLQARDKARTDLQTIIVCERSTLMAMLMMVMYKNMCTIYQHRCFLSCCVRQH